MHAGAESLEEFDFDHARGLKREVIAHLGTLDFVITTGQRWDPAIAAGGRIGQPLIAA
jgi:hypothetical protein